MIQLFGICLVLFGLVGCATTPGASIMYSPHGNLLAVGYDADRSESTLKTQRAAQQHCQQQGNQRIQLLSTVTVYQGRFDQTTTEAAKAAGDVAWVYGEWEAAQAGRALSSPTDYKTTIEFTCRQ
jgi:hypothetical protein